MFKYLAITCLGICLAGSAFSQALHDATGNWYGSFRTTQGNRQRLQLNFTRQNGLLKGTMKSPDATDDPISVDSVYATDDSLRFHINQIGLVYKGEWNTRNGRYEGYFEQRGNRAELNFSRREIKAGELPVERPQDPQPPFAYDVEEVKFVNKKDKVLLTGTFTRPGLKGTFPVVIMISGEGPQNRDGEHVGHKPFAVIAHYFARHGMAVLRFDDRGTGTSTGNYDSSNIYNFAEDVRAAVSFLRTRSDVDSNAIGLLGTGLGGVEGQLVAADDQQIAFLMMMGTPGVDGRTAYLSRIAQISLANGDSEADIRQRMPLMNNYLDVLTKEKDTTVRKEKALGIIHKLMALEEDSVTEEVAELSYLADNHPEVISAIQYNPAAHVGKIKCPVLLMNGEKDLEVNAQQNVKSMREALVKGGNQTVTVKTFPGLNHWLQRCNSCTIDEYGSLDETINPAVMEFMVRWIQLLY